MLIQPVSRKVGAATLSEDNWAPGMDSIRKTQMVASRAINDVEMGDTTGLNREVTLKTPVGLILAMRYLIDEILTQIGKMTEVDKQKAENLKLECKTTASGVADKQRAQGRDTVMLSVLQIGLSLAKFGFSNGDDRQMMESIAQLVPGFGKAHTEGLAAQQHELQTQESLLHNALQSMSSDKQLQSGNKQEVLEFLRNILGLLKVASSVN